ncbi:UDP-D-apiose/UDP-D-xylose synthase [Hordeum vulgare]|nr:UDP-D-apiose/UDP-D-xylose synthase [Hordeum vulgare]
MASGGRVDLDGGAVAPLTICMIGADGFIGSHLCEKLMAETPHVVLAVNVYPDKIRHLVDPPPPHLAGRISFHRLNIKNDPRLDGLVKMADLTINLAAICTPADYNTRPLNTIYSNFIDALPVDFIAYALYICSRTLEGGLVGEKLWDLMANELDVVMEEGFPNATGSEQSIKGMRTSELCLHRAGDTPSSCRLFDTVSSLCIPIIVSDDIELPFKGMIDYTEFSIFV